MPLAEPLLFLLKLGYTLRLKVPLFILFLCFLLDIRMQLNVTVQRIEIPRNAVPDPDEDI
ncbi:hypothetical protein TcasGA2_TC006675 [Tribolium castaneum]|uniref:Uncharacterized protein n=1 Tax=Tribolium castaneum TaxID=7070 RepID=D6WYE7_TRICA|nr:hypothetical protein TcasGA2_TC006675 [Tribolium castaneum]